MATHTIGPHIFYQIVSSESRLMEPCRTSDTDVTYGVPQGSVLGPILFLLYINDINENVQSSIRLFADDSIIYCKINSNIDHQILQTDLNSRNCQTNGKCRLIYQNVCTFQLQAKLNQAHTSIRYLDTRFLK